MTVKEITLCHSNSPLKDKENNVWCWDNPKVKGVNSLLQYVEENSDRLRKELIKFYYQLGETKVGGKSLVSELQIDQGVSFWWLTVFVEKSIYKSPITNALRFIAFEEIICRQDIKIVNYLGSSRIISKTLSQICHSKKIDFNCKHKPYFKFKLSFFKILKYQIKAILFLINYIRKRWFFRNSLKTQINSGDDFALICGYLQNIDKNINIESSKSNYWGDLPKVLSEHEIKQNWLNIYTEYDCGPTSNDALKWACNFNQSNDNLSAQFFIHRRFSIKLIIKVLSLWIRIQYIMTKSTGSLSNNFKIKNSHLTLFILFEENFLDSFFGPSALSSLVWFQLFDEEISNLPKHKMCLYLCENQNWEKALLFAWKKYQKCPIIAVPHTTIRYWDLRYFFCNEAFKLNDCQMPEPDIYAVNATNSVNELVNSGIQKDKIVECEALRYMHLFSAETLKRKTRTISEKPKVLILGDYSSKVNSELFEIVKDSLEHFCVTPQFFLKPHPRSSSVEDFCNNLNFILLTNNYDHCLDDFDFVLASNYTSASVDMFITGHNVLIANPSDSVNFNPLRGVKGVHFINSGESLAGIIDAAKKTLLLSEPVRAFYFLDNSYPRWNRLIKSYESL